MTPTVRPVDPAHRRLDGHVGWMSASYSEGIYDDPVAGGLRLGDEHATAILPTEPSGTFGGATRPTGLAVGPNGRLFLADPSRNRILSYTTHDGRFLALWESPPEAEPPACPLPDPDSEPTPSVYALLGPRGVAYSRDGDLVVADTGHSRVILYAWPHLVARHVIALQDAVLGAGEPWDLAYDSRGWLYVADAAANRVRRYDRLWREDESYPGGAGELTRPKHLAIDADDRLYVLHEGGIVAYDERGRSISGDLTRDLHLRRFPLPLALEGQGLWLPQDERPECPRLALDGLRVDRAGRLVGTGLPLLARPSGVRYPRSGHYRSLALDSGLYDCAWHRLVLDADVPASTSLTVRTFTSPAELEERRIASLPSDRWSIPLTIGPDDRPEVLIQSPPGRYLWLDVTLNGDGSSTPLVRAITLYAPRRSSLQYLPPVFHEDAVSADFLDRFLSYFDTIYDEIETQIERFSGYLDPDGAPSGPFLAWLGSWLDVAFMKEWDDATRREFVRRAIALYKRRGTVGGLQEVLRLHAGLSAPMPAVIEHYRLRNYAARHEAGGLVNGQLYLAGRALGPAAGEVAHHFTVLVPEQVVPDDEAREALEHVIDGQKPAHTHYELRVVKAGLRIGCQSTIGVDALIGAYPSAPLDEFKLGQSGQVAPEPPRLGRTALVRSA